MEKGYENYLRVLQEDHRKKPFRKEVDPIRSVYEYTKFLNDLPEEERLEMTRVLGRDSYIDKRDKLKEGAGGHVYGLQAEKNMIMRQLTSVLSRDGGIELAKSMLYPKGDIRKATFSKAENGIDTFTVGGKEVTFGAMLADMLWGIHYNFDKKHPPSSHLSRRYALELAKMRLHQLLNEQLASSLIDKYKRRGDDGRKQLYNEYGRSYRTIDKKDLEASAPLIAELGVQAALIARSWDTPDASFRVWPADLQEDISQGNDCYVSFGDGSELVGVDITTAKDGAVLEEKRRKIRERNSDPMFDAKEVRPADRRVLVVEDAERWIEHYRAWINNNRPSGGPQQYVPETVLRQSLAPIFEGHESAWGSEV